MTIARELITKLGFKVDKTGLESFEKSILGFKTKFLLVSGAIAATVNKTLDYFKGISTAARDTEYLAEQTGIATARFVALRRTAEDFQLSPDKFNAYFLRLSELLRGGKAGVGELFDLLHASRGQLNLTPFIQSGDVEGAFKAVLRYVGSLKDAKDQAAALKATLGESNTGLLAIVKAGVGVFEEGTKANMAYGESYVRNIPATKEFTEQLNKFDKQLEKVTLSFVENLLPAITKTLDYVDKAFKGLGIISEESKQTENSSGTQNGINYFVSALSDAILPLLGLETETGFKNRVLQENTEFYRRLGEYQKEQRIGMNQGSTTINSKIEVNVAPGTPQEQAQLIGAGVRSAMEQFWDEKTREVLNNNPQAE